MAPRRGGGPGWGPTPPTGVPTKEACMTHRRTPRRSRAGALVLSALAALVLVGGPAVADDDDDREIRREGSCDAGTQWKVKAKNDDGRIEFEGEVDSNKTGQTWSWKMKHNGSVSARG